MQVNFEGFNRICETLTAGMQSLRATLDTSWSDGVHDSFEVYFNDVQRCMNDISNTLTALKSKSHDFEAIDINELAKQYEQLNLEASGFNGED